MNESLGRVSGESVSASLLKPAEALIMCLLVKVSLSNYIGNTIVAMKEASN